MRHIILSLATILCAAAQPALAQAESRRASSSPADAMLADYLRTETEKLSARCLTQLRTKDDWDAARPGLRKQLLDMLGLEPWPERTDLKPVVTGTLDHAQFTVEKLHFQSRPGLYVTANLYVPKNLTKPAPAILYVCGHSNMTKGNVPLGNKTGYQHHGAWFARNGYVCLVIDTVQLGEIPGVHHGLYRENMWWWLDRGYTPAGVEAWNSVRAIDYLQTRKEVDPDKIGMTGRSGGGAYTWWTAAIDDRVKAAAPVAGITDLQDHVVDGCVEGHCDCMYMNNTFLWDYPQAAALVAPRPLLLVNTDKDPIFPLGGVMRTHDKVRHVYDLLGAGNEFAPTIGEGGHKDTQELQVAVFRWFNRKLKGEDPVIETAAVKLFEPERLRVFEAGKEPADAINGRIHETFVPLAAKAEVPKTKEAWEKQRDAWTSALRDKCFHAWPGDTRPAAAKELPITGRDRLRDYMFESEPGVQLRLVAGLQDRVRAPEGIDLYVAESPARAAELVAPGQASRLALAFVPRGAGSADLPTDDKQRTHLLRRFWLLGRTLESTQSWDVRRALQAVRSLREANGLPVRVHASGSLAGVVVYASLFEPAVEGLDLTSLPPTHAQGPHFLNVLRVLDLPQAVAMAAERSTVTLEGAHAADWAYATETAAALGWPKGKVGLKP